jgi:hypothetical protein
MTVYPHQRLHRFTAWIVFLIAFIVYARTVEDTASFWDCGEYIACAWGIEVGHPPGAPLFLLLGRLAGLLSFGNTENVALFINLLSALASAFTIFFLYLSIVALARKAVQKRADAYQLPKLHYLAGMVGALSFAFTDTFWFSAVEGEVYALSSLFTAIVVWGMLRWDAVADEPGADRWLVFIAYMIGLSVGVHLLNLLCIPALVFIWYFRTYTRVTRLGLLLAGIASLLLLGGIQNVLIPGVVNLCGKTELFFVNDLNFPFNSGTIFYFALLTVLLAGGIAYSQWRKRRVLNTSLLALTTLLIGYSSFFILIIRAQASPPINEGNTSNAVSLLSYLNREQYGDWPLLHGRTYATPLDAEEPWVDANPVYVRDERTGKYVISFSGKAAEANYDNRASMFFPRMWSSGHAQAYKSFTGEPADSADVSLAGNGGEYVKIPSQGQNMKYFWGQQIGWMYARYFMWNFVGRQNDRASSGNDAEGNVRWSMRNDVVRNGEHFVPHAQRNNKASNFYFYIPLLLGIMGMVWHFKVSSRDGFFTLLLFLFTGLAIAVYLNMTPWQPRERDYAFVGSFYAWAFWIGIGVFPLFEWINTIMKKIPAALTGTLVLSLLSPVVLLQQNFNDHNRSGRTAARDFAINLLESCDENAILITYADNDTFTLWFAQEVLGIRRDVRVVCLSLLQNDWYIDQMKRRQYTSAPLPITMQHHHYKQGKRDYVNIDPRTMLPMRADSIIAYATSTRKDQFRLDSYGDTSSIIPAQAAYLPVNKTAYAKQAGLSITQMQAAHDTIVWAFSNSYMMKDQLVVLDILAHHNWERPVYFAPGMPGTAYSGLNDYLQAEGLAWRLTPFFHPDSDRNLTTDPACSAAKTFTLFQQKFGWGGLKNERVYADETVERMFCSPMRSMCAVAAEALLRENKPEQAAQLIARCIDEIPHTQTAPDEYWTALTAVAFASGNNALAEKMARISLTHAIESLRWYSFMQLTPYDRYEQQATLQKLYELALLSGNQKLADEIYTQAAPYAELGLPQEMLPDADSLPVGDSADSVKKKMGL